eukprot:2289720-Alexandrium_andersonii.AAC.1
MFQVPRAPPVQTGTFALAPLSSCEENMVESSDESDNMCEVVPSRPPVGDAVALPVPPQNIRAAAAVAA